MPTGRQRTGAAQGGAAGDSRPNGQSGSKLADSAKQTASRAKEMARGMLDTAKDQAKTRLEEQRETLASGIRAVAPAVRSLGEDLKRRDGGPVAFYGAGLGNAIAGRVENAAEYLQRRDVQQIVADAEAFARRSPATFIASAFAIGFVASRFLKSSPTSSPQALQSGIRKDAHPVAGTPGSGGGLDPAGGI